MPMNLVLASQSFMQSSILARGHNSRDEERFDAEELVSKVKLSRISKLCRNILVYSCLYMKVS